MKALETEYKKQISLDIPDLWDRIEAGVDEYEATKTTEAEVKVVDIDRKKKNNKKIIVMIGKIAGAAACMLLAATVIFNFGTRKNASIKADSGMAFMANSTTCEEAPAAEYAAEAAEEAYWTDEEAVECEESVAADTAGTAMTETAEETAPAMDNAAAKEASEVKTADVLNEAAKDSAVSINADTAEMASIIADDTACGEQEAAKIAAILADCDVVTITEISRLPVEIMDSDWYMSNGYWNINTDVYGVNAIDVNGDSVDYGLYIERNGDSSTLKAIGKDKPYKDLVYENQ